MNNFHTSSIDEIYYNSPSYCQFSPNPHNVIKVEDYLMDPLSMDLGPQQNEVKFEDDSNDLRKTKINKVFDEMDDDFD